jgi:hypothetical protein
VHSIALGYIIGFEINKEGSMKKQTYNRINRYTSTAVGHYEA